MGWYIISGPSQIGKTRISNHLSMRTYREIVSTDDLLTDYLGITISDFFVKFGASDSTWRDFRKKENEVLRQIKNNYSDSDIILDTGGGLLTPENRFHLANKDSLKKVIDIRDENLEILNSNGVICTLLPFEDLLASQTFVSDIANKKALKEAKKSNRASQGKYKSAGLEAFDKLGLRWDSYNHTSDFIYYIGDRKPTKFNSIEDEIDPHALNVLKFFEPYR
jgi:hypothetical protein